MTAAAIAAMLAAVIFTLAAVMPTGDSHACTAPCVVHGLAAEDGYRADYLHGGTLHVTEVRP